MYDVVVKEVHVRYLISWWVLVIFCLPSWWINAIYCVQHECAMYVYFISVKLKGSWYLHTVCYYRSFIRIWSSFVLWILLEFGVIHDLSLLVTELQDLWYLQMIYTMAILDQSYHFYSIVGVYIMFSQTEWFFSVMQRKFTCVLWHKLEVDILASWGIVSFQLFSEMVSGYRDSAGNTVEENFSIFCLIWMR